jgi:hypothetical protein
MWSWLIHSKLSALLLDKCKNFVPQKNWRCIVFVLSVLYYLNQPYLEGINMIMDYVSFVYSLMLSPADILSCTFWIPYLLRLRGSNLGPSLV